MSLRIVPVDLKTAREFVAVHHRHNEPPVGHKFRFAPSMPEGREATERAPSSSRTTWAATEFRRRDVIPWNFSAKKVREPDARRGGSVNQ